MLVFQLGYQKLCASLLGKSYTRDILVLKETLFLSDFV